MNIYLQSLFDSSRLTYACENASTSDPAPNPTCRLAEVQLHAYRALLPTSNVRSKLVVEPCMPVTTPLSAAMP
jgi:hypothetical protein